MMIYWRWLRLGLSYCFFFALIFLALHHGNVMYLISQAKGQVKMLMSTSSIEGYKKNNRLSKKQSENLDLIQSLKQFSVDRLGYKPTKNFNRVLDQKKTDTLWVITASEPYDMKAYEWRFPLIGRVSYKGYFDKTEARKERNLLKKQEYDVSISRVEAWSTLGWFSDPVLSSMLEREKGSLCNLIFHELFHATYYAPNQVNLNENLAGFIAHKATLYYLSNDSAAFSEYMRSYEDQKTISDYMLRQSLYLKNYYQQIYTRNDRSELKEKTMSQIARGLDNLKLHFKPNFERQKTKILQEKNAAFIDFMQYHGLRDSLELVFNKIYRGNIKKMLNDLKQN